MAAAAAGYRKGLVSAGWPVLVLSCVSLADSAWQLGIEKAWSVLNGPFLVRTNVENGLFKLNGAPFLASS